MKKIISALLLSSVAVSGMNTAISAIEPQPAIETRWSNVVSIIGGITFSGTTGCYNLLLRGASEVDRITATATLYYKNSAGDWVETSTVWSYDVESTRLPIDETFSAVSGVEYKIELEATVYMNGYGEPISKTSTNTCP